MEEINKLVDEKLAGDTEFQATLSALTEEEKNTSLENKRKEILEGEIKSIREKALDADKQKEFGNNQKTRAERAEADLKKLKPQEKKQDDDNRLSTTDFYALTNAKVPEEDIADVTEYAKFKGISISEALKSPVVGATLAQKAESRRVAQAMNIRSTRSQDSSIDGGAIIKDIKNKGEEAIPEGGSKEAEALFWQRRGKPQPK